MEENKKRIENIEKDIDEFKKILDEKKDGEFVYSLLSDIVELKYERLYNLMLGIMGIASPIIPIIFLFRRELINEVNIIFILIISIIINLIIFVICIIFVTINRQFGENLKYNIIALKATRLRVNNYKQRIIIKKIECRTILLENKISKNIEKIDFIKKIFLKLQTIWIKKTVCKVESKSKKIDKNIEEIETLIKKYEYEIEKKDKSIDFIEVIVMNTIIGGTVVLLKAISYLGVDYINFKYIIKFTIIMYLFIASRFIFKYIFKLIIKIIILLYRIIYNGKFEQKKVFKDNNIEL